MRIWELGDFVDTDAILPAKYLNNNNPSYYSQFCLESLINNFSEKVKEGDVIVAGECFGYGSSRESAPFAIKYLGIKAIFAISFSRIFMRNAINIGLPVVEINEQIKKEILYSEEIKFNSDYSKIVLVNRKKEQILPTKYSPFIQEIIKCGGLMKYYEKFYAEETSNFTR